MPLSDEADRKFFEESRRRSPQFPDVATYIERRQRAKETLAARILLMLSGVFLVAVPFAEEPWWAAGAAGAMFTGFVITCFVAGNRAYIRAGGRGGRPC